MSIDNLLHRPSLTRSHRKAVYRWQEEATEDTEISPISKTMSSTASAAVNNSTDVWSAHYDEDSGNYFYVNSISGETQWEQPPGFVHGADAAAAIDGDADGAAAAAADGGGGGGGGEDEWTAMLDEDSGSYFFINNITGATTWENPYEAAAADAAAAVAASSDGGSLWTEQQDETGAVFYFNSATGESSWKMPAEMMAAAAAAAADDADVDATAAAGGALVADDAWAEVTDGGGDVYYYNTASGETSWDPPPQKQLQDANAAEWVQRYDESSGMSYFENTRTLETQWENPYENEMLPISMDIVETMASPVPSGGMSLFASQELHLPAFSPDSRAAAARDRRLASPDAARGGAGAGSVNAAAGEAAAPEEFLAEFLQLELEDLPDAAADASNSINSSSGSSGSGSGSDGGVGGSHAQEMKRSAQQISALAVLDAIDASGQQQLSAAKAADVILSVPADLLRTNIVLSHLTKKVKPFTLEAFAEVSFQYDRRVSSRSTTQSHPVEKMLGFQAEPLKAPLTALSSSHLHAEALAAFRTIQRFMSSGRLAEAPPLELIDELLARFMGAPSELQDEIYCQLCKQTRRNPSAESASMAWQLLLVSLAAVPPSKRILAHLINYFSSTLQQLSNSGSSGAGAGAGGGASKSSATTGGSGVTLISSPKPSAAATAAAALGGSEKELEKFVYLCLKCCAPAAAAPPRSELLLPLEIRSILLGEAMELDVYTLDYRYHRCRIDSFSTVSDLTAAMCDRLGISEAHSAIFSLWEAQYDDDGVETMSHLGGSLRLVDWVAHCERITVCGFGGSDGEERESFSLPPQADHMLHLTTPAVAVAAAAAAAAVTGESRTGAYSAQQQSVRLAVQHAREEWNSPATFAHGIPQKLFFKARYMLDITEHMDDPVALHLLYLQAQYDVYTAHYAHSHADVVFLAALKLQEVFGDYVPGTRTLGEISKHSHAQQALFNLPITLQRLVSPHALSNSTATQQEIEQRIIGQYKSLVGIPRGDVRGMYLMFVSSWKLFGTTFFVVDGHVNSNSNQYSEVVMSISARSIILIDPRTMAFLAEYTYEDVLSWGYSFDAFVLVLGSKAAQVKSYFKTPQGKAIDSLVNVYQKHFHSRRRHGVVEASPSLADRKKPTSKNTVAFQITQ